MQPFDRPQQHRTEVAAAATAAETDPASLAAAPVLAPTRRRGRTLGSPASVAPGPGSPAAAASTSTPSTSAPSGGPPRGRGRAAAAPSRTLAGPTCDRCRREIPLPSIEGVRIGEPDDVAALLVPLIGGADREHCLALQLDTKHRVLATTTVSIGSLDHTFMTPLGIFRDALLANAAAVVLAHNHPSGDPEPSRDDERVTRRLVEAGRIMGVEVLDHLVVGGGTWVSLARRGIV
jgi:DNA repair protein RadC